MQFDDLKILYLDLRNEIGDLAYKQISLLFERAKILHKKDWEKNPTPNGDHEQSWRAFKGKNMEKLIQFILKEEIEGLGLKIINGNKLERSRSLPKDLSIVKRNLAIDYGLFGLHLPDVDIIIYHPKTYNILAVISCKVTLRERIAQTGYWKLKLMEEDLTKNIKVYFITPDEDKTLSRIHPTKKGRAIVEVDTDGAYVMTEEEIEESSKVKSFGKFINDIKILLKHERH